MIKAILFDFDGVLTTDATGSHSTCNYISKKTGIDIELIKKEYYKFNKDLLIGKITHNDIWQILCEYLNFKIDINLLHESFISTPVDDKMISIVRELKKQNFKIGMITDNKKDRIDAISKYYIWDELFDITSISAQVGSGKDSEDIFIKTMNLLGVNPDECIFIDNQQKNLIVPNKLGMKAIYFDHEKRDYQKLIEEMRDKFGKN